MTVRQASLSVSLELTVKSHSPRKYKGFGSSFVSRLGPVEIEARPAEAAVKGAQSMAKMVSDGLSRLQSQSRIPANTWRQWCHLLKLDPIDAVGVWEEICCPIMVATRKLPDIPIILQMRAARLDLNIFDFKEEAPKPLHVITFLYALKDPCLTTGKVKSSLLKFYKKTAHEHAPGQQPYLFIQQFLQDICSAILVAKVLPTPNITLSGVLTPVFDGRATLRQVVQLGLKSLEDQPYADSVRECLSLPDLLTVGAATAESPAGRPTTEAADGEEEDGFKDDEDGDLFDIFLLRFKTALRIVYEAEAKVDKDQDNPHVVEQAVERLEKRLKVITLFKPLQATIPSIEEAQTVGRRMKASQNVVRTHKPTLGASGGSPASDSSSQPLTGADPKAKIIKSEGKKQEQASAGGLPPSSSAPLGSTGLIDIGRVNAGIQVAVADRVEPEEISLSEFGGKVRLIGRLLAAIEPLDQMVWSLFLDPTATLKDCRVLARTVGTADSAPYNAYQTIKQIARCLPLKDLLPTSDQVVRRDRNFAVEVSSFINHVKGNRELDPQSRQVAPLPRILNHSAGALMRLESLKTNAKFARELPEEYSQEAVTFYYEQALRSITDLSDQTLRQKVRQRADADTGQLLEFFEVEKFVEQLVETVRSYAQAIRKAGGGESVKALKAIMADKPLEFVDAELVQTEKVPPDLLVASGLGEIFDEMYQYVGVQAWAVMAEAHRPAETIGRLREVLREIMVSSFVVTPEMRRHQEQAKFALAVVSLDKISGTGSLRDFYVRVRDDGRIAYLEDFADGSYVDLFELRAYQPSRVHHAAKKKATEGQAEELQKGRKYLFTVGRTNRLFGESPSDLINGCVRSKEGGPKIFRVF